MFTLTKKNNAYTQLGKLKKGGTRKDACKPEPGGKKKKMRAKFGQMDEPYHGKLLFGSIDEKSSKGGGGNDVVVKKRSNRSPTQ